MYKYWIQVLACMQAKDAAPQSGHLHTAPWLDAAGALRQQARCAATSAAPVITHSLAPWGHSTHVRMHQPDWLLMDLQAPDAARNFCALPQPPRRQGALVLQSCQGTPPVRTQPFAAARALSSQCNPAHGLRHNTDCLLVMLAQELSERNWRGDPPGPLQSLKGTGGLPALLLSGPVASSKYKLPLMSCCPALQSMSTQLPLTHVSGPMRARPARTPLQNSFRAHTCAPSQSTSLSTSCQPFWCTGAALMSGRLCSTQHSF